MSVYCFIESLDALYAVSLRMADRPSGKDVSRRPHSHGETVKPSSKFVPKLTHLRPQLPQLPRGETAHVVVGDVLRVADQQLDRLRHRRLSLALLHRLAEGVRELEGGFQGQADDEFLVINVLLRPSMMFSGPDKRRRGGSFYK
jgi:hypothetical protein